MTSTAFSSSDDVISRKIDCKTQVTEDEDLINIYEINSCRDWLTKHCFNNVIISFRAWRGVMLDILNYMKKGIPQIRHESPMVALQFPDELLVDAPKVTKVLQEIFPNTSFFILGDTSYGSCCVDEIGAQHYKADCIIHYGCACLSPTTRLPVFYVFGKASFNVTDCVSKVELAYSEKSKMTVLMYDTSYAHVADEVFQRLKAFLPALVLSKLNIASNATMSNFSLNHSYCHTNIEEKHHSFQKCGRVTCLPEKSDIDESSIIFLGSSDCTTLISLMMTFNKCSFFIYDPQKLIFEPTNVNINKALMRRYYLIERAKDASIVGIVVGTLGIERYKEIIDHLKVLLKNAGKKSYTFVVGKLNPAKLANFAEVDIYVLVSCLESSLLDQKDFYRPVVTPFEMEMACNPARQWNGDYTTEFVALLPGSAMHVEAPEEYTGEGDVSLISNRIRIMGQRETIDKDESDVRDVVKRSDAMALAGVAENAGEFFSLRSWQGLERQLGETPVVKASEGQKGIAASYQNENVNSVNE